MRAPSGKNVCGRCFGEPGMIDFCEAYAVSKRCNFCGRRGREPIAAPLHEALGHVKDTVYRFYDDPANAGLGYESAEGGYQGNTFYTDDVFEALGLDFTEDGTDTLHDLTADHLGNDLWCDRDPYGLSEEDRLGYSWDSFCRLIKHERRYFFLSRPQSASSELLSPADTLDRIFEYAKDAGGFVDLPAGTRVYRARRESRGEHFSTAGQLGPPPTEYARQANRMSPAGIAMTYVGDDQKTALAETADKPGRYAVGEFETTRSALILDLTDLPAPPSPFHEIPDSYEYDPRPRLLFLRRISEEISKPIARDDRTHIEYVPTQVITEYVRSAIKVDGRRVDGVRYRSSRNPDGTALVLFAERDNLILDPPERGEWYSLSEDRWLRLASARSIRVSANQVRRYRSHSDS